jgi:hypothetical protein
MHSISTILLIGLAIGLSQSKQFLTTTCLASPTLTTMTNFNQTAFISRWYVQSAGANYPGIRAVQCSTFDVWADEVFIGVNLNFFGFSVYENYNAPALVCTGTSGTCNLDLDDTYITFDVIATDYTSYAIVYICGYENDAGGVGTVSAVVVLTANPTASATDIANY